MMDLEKSSNSLALLTAVIGYLDSYFPKGQPMGGFEIGCVSNAKYLAEVPVTRVGRKEEGFRCILSVRVYSIGSVI